MQSKPTRWACQPYDVALAERLASGLGVSRPVGAILARRGFADVGEARRFLAADERHDPLTLPGVPAACELIAGHLRRGSRIAVFGDYDVDGVCSTAMLVRTLRALGGDPAWELPSRFDEGYGLSAAAVERLAARGVGLLVTVDCGITAVEQVAAARAAGLDVVVTDHHRPGDELPDCVVVHPALGEYGCPELCASGVVLKLCEALHANAGGDPRAADEDLDLAALATVCDLVPLRGENRRIVREGLAAIARTQKPGLRALMAVAAVEPAELTEQSLGFRLGPRINAAGRMRRADAALELLLTDDADRAREVARELDLLNGDRQQAETRILFAAETASAAQASQAAIVVAGEDWHPGVVGIVASRLVERWRRPCVVIALDEHGSGRGSGRSISPYDLHAGLAACAGHLTRFGGHRMAAGVELDADAVDGFRSALAAHAGAALTPADMIPVERVDAVVPGGLLGLGLAEELETLRPFGMGNPQPTLLVPAARFQNVTGMGEERQHTRFTLVTAGGARSRGVAFGTPPKALTPAADDNHDIALRLERNRWKGVVEPRTILRALCPTRSGELRVLGEEGTFWERLQRALAGAAERVADADAPAPLDRRLEGFAGVAGDLFTSGERVLVAVADVDRRRAGLEQIVAGLAEDGMAVASWSAIAADPQLARAHDHVVALDPPPGGLTDPLLHVGPGAHLAWGPAEAEFALQVWRAELGLRPALADAYRALRELPPDAGPDALQGALCGSARYPRTPESCARLAGVLTELGLIELSADVPSFRLLEAARTDLERSATYRAAAERLAAIERALAGELPAAADARAA
ncbi:MAG: single-stranded-DNA-specific exonuclease [Thermoleophilaceae bacterium]|nr:single-stranded-DNA-specific exonuclease [Thermoleophilaceae bacterium]